MNLMKLLKRDRKAKGKTDPLKAYMEELANLPRDWHSQGILMSEPLNAIARHCEGLDIQCSAETGSGLSTLLFSQLSRRHLVFTLEQDDSSRQVRASPLLKEGICEFVLGPTQRTIPRYDFKEPLQVIFLDGPHGYPFPEIEYCFLYPHLEPGGLLILDDIHIPTIFNLFQFLREEAMFRLLDFNNCTAFFQRTDAPTFPNMEDGWWTQAYNKRRFPVNPNHFWNAPLA